MLMERDLFEEQLRATAGLSESDALRQQQIREELGHVAVIKFVPVNGNRPDDPSFWRDVAGKALRTDGIAPYFLELPSGDLVRGIALWRLSANN